MYLAITLFYAYLKYYPQAKLVLNVYSLPSVSKILISICSSLSNFVSLISKSKSTQNSHVCEGSINPCLSTEPIYVFL